MSAEVEVQGGVTLVTWRRPDVRNAVDASTASTITLRRRRAVVTASLAAGIGGRPRMPGRSTARRLAVCRRASTPRPVLSKNSL